MSRSDAFRVESERLHYISVANINKDGLFRNGTCFTIRSSSYGRELLTGVCVYICEPVDRYLTLNYSINNKEDDRYQNIGLTYTKCYFGGKRWWMLCPYCHRRIGKLYLLRGYYACRHCHKLTYKSRLENPRAALMPIFSAYDKEIKADELMQSMRTKYYRGVPTKKFCKALNLYRQAGILVDQFDENELRREPGLSR